MNLKLILLAHLVLCITSDTILGGYVLIPDEELPQFLTSPDDAFQLTYTAIHNFFQTKLGLTLGVPIQCVKSVAYQISAGIEYIIILDTPLNICRVVAYTVFWEQSVSSPSIAFISGTKTDNSTNYSAILSVDAEISTQTFTLDKNYIIPLEVPTDENETQIQLKALPNSLTFISSAVQSTNLRKISSDVSTVQTEVRQADVVYWVVEKASSRKFSFAQWKKKMIGKEITVEGDKPVIWVLLPEVKTDSAT